MPLYGYECTHCHLAFWAPRQLVQVICPSCCHKVVRLPDWDAIVAYLTLGDVKPRGVRDLEHAEKVMRELDWRRIFLHIESVARR